MSDCCTHYSLQVEQDHAVSVDPQADILLVTAGEQGPPGPGAFDLWLERNPGGTWDDFLSELGSGATWQSIDW